MTHVLTLIAGVSKRSLTDALIDDAGRVLATLGARAGAPVILSQGRAVDIPFEMGDAAAEASLPSGGSLDANAVRTALSATAVEGVDLAVIPADGRRKGLLIADMDSTIVTGETLDDLAELAGIGDAVADITRRAMNGEIGFEGALRERVAMLKGRSTDLIEQVIERMTLTPGAEALVATMRSHGARCVLVSGGFTVFTGHVAELAGFDADFGNTLIMSHGSFSGTVGEPILGRDAKLSTLQAECEARNLDTSSAIAVGDGANDLAMIQAAGMGIAFHAKPSVKAAAPIVIDHADLTSLLYLQGYADTDFAET
ncbi:phosphoserine phosphatase SerB [Fodinicurvata sp. EGI_FJ10296]|uniref:phosphoserine phosphatase SerB n=1 Tax=Fodinicurvata sp. EGI_FJ10296 TaxID=3231908 RepID=UPI003454B9BC